MYQTFLNPAPICEIDETEFYQYPFIERYLISKSGKVYDTHNKQILKTSKNGHDYYCVHMKNTENKQSRYTLHRMLAITFIANHENKRCVDHISGDRSDNSLTNLRWVTVQENSQNRKANFNSTSKYVGVYQPKDSSKWYAQIGNMYIGVFLSETAAAEAYNKRANELGFLSRNVID